MRRIIAQEMISIDGFFAGSSGELDWLVWDETLKDYSVRTLAGADTLLFGRVTYELMAGYWPTATENDPTIIKAMNILPKIVFSRSLESVNWNNSRIISEAVPEEIMRLKEQPGKDMVIYGSGTLVSAIARMGLLDEYRLIVNPVVLGTGKPLFRERMKVKLLETRKLGSGNVLLRYTPEQITPAP